MINFLVFDINVIKILQKVIKNSFFYAILDFLSF